ncbi:MAG: glyoxylate/hydroxypyruvate reductase A [Rhodospirillales bacterium]|nr:glyoxylate/hydroxypyruvate reductase A [Rhodospirillales bacterium]
MAFLFGASTYDNDEWTAALRRHLPDLEIRLWPDQMGDPADIEYVMVQSVRRFDFSSIPNVKIIFTMGAGAGYILKKPELPQDVPIVRAVSDGVVTRMVQYVQYAVLHFHRQFDQFRKHQAKQEWLSVPGPENAERRVGVLGLGSIGEPTARMLAEMGFDTAGWSRTKRNIEGVTGYCGPQGLTEFLARTDILVCLLPLTAETTGILNAETLRRLPKGACLINVGCGGHLVEQDLLTALDHGHIAGAMLDVFAKEPPPEGHPFWTHPKVVVTPHAAGWNDPESAAAHVARNIRNLAEGKPLHPVVNRGAGY